MRLPLILAFLAASPALAEGGPTGPAASAIKSWFESSPDVRCFSKDGNGDLVACKVDANTNFKVFYGNGQDALAFVAYIPDSTGNAEEFRAAVFHKDGSRWKFESRISNQFAALPDKARFEATWVSIDLKFRRKSDYRIQPTGRFNLRVNFARHTMPTPQTAKALPPDGLSARDYLAWIYEPYVADRRSIDIDVRNVDRVYGERLAKAFRAAVTYAREGNGPGGLGDPFVNAQEYQIRDLGIRTVEKGDDRVEGIVSYRNLARPNAKVETVRLDLRKEGAGWRIEEIVDHLGRKNSDVLAIR